MVFKAGDKVVGNNRNFSHRIGQTGTVLMADNSFITVEWSDGDIVEVPHNHVDWVDNQKPPRKMHPDDFMSAISEFAADNGFHIKEIEVLTKGGNKITRSFPYMTRI